MESLTPEQKSDLIDEHVRLTAQFVQGNNGAKMRLQEIESTLDMSPVEIARLATDSYLKEY